MAEKRRDSKGRILKNGERQRSDGRYEYRYQDIKGEWHSKYSWRLVPTDKIVVGKNSKKSLREIESDVEKNMATCVNNADARSITLDDMVQIFLQTKKIRPQSLSHYRLTYNKYTKEEIGYTTLAKLDYALVKKHYDSLIEKTTSYHAVSNVHNTICPALDIAVERHIIPANPIVTALKRALEDGSDIIRPKIHRRALTPEEQSAFLDGCLEVEPFWYPVFIFLLGTGVRVGELSALQDEDIDEAHNVIHISKSYVAYSSPDGRVRCISKPKTNSSNRIIPMMGFVKTQLGVMRRMKEGKRITSPELSGYNHFVFCTPNGTVIEPTAINKVIQRICDYCNSNGMGNIEKFSVHQLRHTFCTRLYEHEGDIKVVQEVMGHASARTTLDIYTEVSMSRKVSAMMDNEANILNPTANA